MREGPSLTAAWVAVARQLGELLPPEAQLIDDPYGAAFAGPRLAFRFERHRRGSVARALSTLPGVRSFVLYMQVRSRVIDDEVRAFVESGGRQVILLGAGYDCRALRLPELIDTRVVEVDHPATQERKQRVLARIGAESPSRYLAWDFEHRAIDELPAALAGLGHDRALPTLTIWEGVTMYLTEPAIDGSVRAIKSYSSGGSMLVMTYVASDHVEKPALTTRLMMAAVARIGEPWRFGWDPANLPGYLGSRGFTLARDVALADAAHRLLPAEFARGLGFPGRRIATVSTMESIAVATVGG